MRTVEPADASTAPGRAAVWRNLTLGALAAWVTTVSILGTIGLFSAIPLPAVAALVALGIGAPLALYFADTGFRAYMRTVPIERLTVFHIWRIPAALAFFHHGSQGLLPDAFVRNAAWGDLIAGLLVPVVLLMPKGRSKFLGFHLFGMADFVLAVGTGLYFSIVDDPEMATIAVMPLVVIPLFGVCVSGVSHVIAIDRLLAERRVAGGRAVQS